MQQEIIDRLQGTTLSSSQLTHARLKHFAGIAQTSEDHISRIGMALSIKEGGIDLDWEPTSIGEHDAPMSVITGKQIRGKTIFKNDLLVFIALANQHQQVTDYDQWRSMMNAHWERGVQRLTELSNGQRDWIRILDSI
jgi:hypothetical protein